jgi:uncharacterized lipoprotein YbaY
MKTLCKSSNIRSPAFFGALLAFLVVQVASGAAQVKGTATYRERIALTPDAVFEATLEDVSKADAPAVVVGSVRIDKPGQVPIRFEIPYDPARIDQRAQLLGARSDHGWPAFTVHDRSGLSSAHTRAWQRSPDHVAYRCSFKAGK